MNRQIINLGAAGVLVIVAGCQMMGGKERGDAGATETQVTMDQVPEPVRAAFRQAHPGVTPTEIEKETHADGRTEYAFEFQHNGREQEVEFDANGKPVTEDEGADRDD